MDITKRLPYIDQLKGLAILLVVIGHVYNFNIPNPNEHFLFRMIYSFHLPLFFIASGFVGKIISDKSLEFLQKKFRSLMIPYIVVSSLYILVISDYRYLFSLNMRSPFWFLLNLFIFNTLVIFISVAHNWFMKHISLYQTNQKFMLALLCFLSIPMLCIIVRNSTWNPFGMMALYYPYYLIGYVIKLNYYKILQYKIYITPICILTYSCILGGINISEQTINNYLMGICMSLILLIFFFQLNEEYTNNRILNRLDYIGKRFLSIYIFHYFFLLKMPVLNNQYFTCNNFTFNFFLSFAIAVAVISMVMVVDKFIKSNSILSFVIYGQSHK